MTLDEAQSQMPEGYTLSKVQTVLLAPDTCDSYAVHVEGREHPQHLSDRPDRALAWAQYDAKRAAERKANA